MRKKQKENSLYKQFKLVPLCFFVRQYFRYFLMQLGTPNPFATRDHLIKFPSIYSALTLLYMRSNAQVMHVFQLLAFVNTFVCIVLIHRKTIFQVEYILIQKYKCRYIARYTIQYNNTQLQRLIQAGRIVKDKMKQYVQIDSIQHVFALFKYFPMYLF